ncbi:MAG TPA: hypothetical protein VLY04_24615 [Bryobacteraceae bacterium]|nr:hypothetical protein [Bryobacteraceae bacterium]
MTRAVRLVALTWSVSAGYLFAASPSDPWLRIQSANFELFTTAGEHSGRDLVRHFEQVRSFFQQVFGAKIVSEKPVRIIVFHSEKEFAPYRPNEAASAFYHPGSEHEYIVMSGSSPEHYQTATHEYTHLLIGQTDSALPLWLNEGLAELYSTFEQVGSQIVVGKAPEGRVRALLAERWIGLDALLATTRDSPLYNEKSRAGMFYAESWALVHMLSLDPEYRAHLRAMLEALKSGDSAEAFQKGLGKTVAEVENDLQAYVRAQYMHGLAFHIQLPKAAETPATEAHAALPSRVALAELLADYPGKLSQAREAFDQLARDFPDRWEAESAVGRFLWRERRNDEAIRHFGRAVGLGATEAHVFIDYARALGVANRAADAAAMLRKAIQLEPSGKEAHYELGLVLVRTADWRGALNELQLARPVTRRQASRFFYGMAFAEYRLGDVVAAHNYVDQGRSYTTIPEEVAALDHLAQSLGPPVVEGVLEAVECADKLAKLHVRVRDFENVFVVPQNSATGEIQCGAHPSRRVRIEYQAMPGGTSGADGMVKSLEFL